MGEWWQSTTLHRCGDDIVVGADDKSEQITVTCAPAHHYSCRTPLDLNLRLWCSWALKTDTLNFYFAGDTAFPSPFPLHSQIQQKLGPFQLSAIPIGAYEPSFFMKDSHCNPHEALKIHRALKSEKSVAIHWGTFPLADEPLEEPPIILKQAIETEGKERRKDDFIVLQHGEEIYSN